jgi:hypothetical protein
MNPIRFFALQLLCTLAWLLTFGACAFVIAHEDQMMMVLQGWAMDEPIELDA